MATFTIYAQTTTGVQIPLGERRLQHTASTAFGELLPLNTWQGGTHVASNDNIEDGGCTARTGHVNNTKWLATSGASSVSLNGAAASNIAALSTANATLRLSFAHPTAVSVTNARFWVYNANLADTSVVTGANYRAYQISNGSSWTTINGSAQYLALSAHTSAATTHDWYVALSFQPTVAGYKFGRFKFVLTYY